MIDKQKAMQLDNSGKVSLKWQCLRSKNFWRRTVMKYSAKNSGGMWLVNLSLHFVWCPSSQQSPWSGGIQISVSWCNMRSVSDLWWRYSLRPSHQWEVRTWTPPLPLDSLWPEKLPFPDVSKLEYSSLKKLEKETTVKRYTNVQNRKVIRNELSCWFRR